LSFTIVIVSSEEGQDKKQMLYLRLDRAINKAEAGIKFVHYFYFREVLERGMPHKHAEAK
jgi:hypothetical protein